MTLRTILVAGAVTLATLTAGSFAATSASAFPISHGHGHGHGHGGWGGGWGGPFMGGIYLNSYRPYADEGCYVVHKKKFIPGVGVVKKRVVICE